MRSFPDTLVKIIKKSDLNINQISMISGISNTYLTKLLRHRINHPGKDKITSVLLALNFTITAINDVLADYDYQPLTAIFISLTAGVLLGVVVSIRPKSALSRVIMAGSLGGISIPTFLMGIFPKNTSKPPGPRVCPRSP